MCPNINMPPGRSEREDDNNNNNVTNTNIHTTKSGRTVEEVLDLQDCSAATLARYLCHERFQGDIPTSTAFLHEALKELEQRSNDHSTTTTTNNTMTMTPILPISCSSSSSARIELPTPTPPQTTGGGGVLPSPHQLGKPLLTQPLETSVFYPRAGKCSIQLYENGYLIATPLNNNKKQTDSSSNVVVPLVIPPKAVSHMVLFAKPEDYKTMANNAATASSSSKKASMPGAPLVLLKLRTGPTKANNKEEEENKDHPVVVTFQGKPIKDQQVCFALSWVKGIGPTGPTGQVGWTEATKAWRQTLEQCLGHSTLTTCQVPPKAMRGCGGGDGTPPSTASTAAAAAAAAAAVFSSYQLSSQSSTTGGMPFVTCYHGVQDGVLFPMREGLLFYKYVLHPS
jgi:hypothetical protein